MHRLRATIVPLVSAIRERIDRDQRRARRARLRFYRSLVPAGGLCFDVGANVGNRVATFVALGARVVAVEPQPNCAAYLRRRYPGSRVTVVEAGAAAAEGLATLRVATSHTVSSMSEDFIAATTTTGRFEGNEWSEAIEVPVTTLARLVCDFGLPDFVKIDVEGFELEVLRGLDVAVPVVSFEFTPEVAAVGHGCVAHLTSLGQYEFNFSAGESMEWLLPAWTGPQSIFAEIERRAPGAWGDIYARLARVAG